jgi:DNA-binding SARP family transcriptional activator
LRFGLLGPVSAWCGDAELSIGPRQQRAVLAVLLLNEGKQVSIDEVTDALWGPDVPRGGTTTVRTYVYRLRRILSAAGRGGRGQEVEIRTDGGGYRLVVDPDSVDVRSFRRHLAVARQARSRGDLAEAAQRLRDGLSLWRGVPFAGVDGPFFDAQRAWLEQLHSTASEERLAVDIEGGRHAEAVAELTAAVADEPYRERLWELLMLALYRCGRQADAVMVYHRVGRLLAEELGLEPGPGLRQLHDRMVAADPSLLGNPDRSVAPRATLLTSNRPAQLPPDVGDFVGRDIEMAEIIEHFSTVSRPPVVEITGAVGMGKSSLAVHAAHAVRDRFPDGQLYVGLHDADGQPVDPGEVLIGFLRALGVEPQAGTGSLGELVAQWRTVLSTRRVLIFLDDAHDSEQLVPLLPSAAGSAAIVTGARRLAGLVGAYSIKVGPLDAGHALELFATIAGRHVLAERAALVRILEICSYQPLPIRCAARWVQPQPTRSVAELEQHICQELRQPLLSCEESRGIEAIYIRALRRLAPDLASACRLMSLPDHDRLDIAEAAALLDMPLGQAIGSLEALVDAHFLETDEFGRYYLHGFAKIVLRRLAQREEGAMLMRAAVSRLAEHLDVGDAPSFVA